MPDGILARMMDAALPFVAGRKLVVVEDAVAEAFAPWVDEESAQHAAIVSATSPDDLRRKLDGAELPAGAFVIVVQPSTLDPVVPAAWKIVDVQYTFPDSEGATEQTAQPTLPPDERWPLSRAAGRVWLDTAKPEKDLACLVIAQVGG